MTPDFSPPSPPDGLPISNVFPSMSMHWPKRPSRKFIGGLYYLHMSSIITIGVPVEKPGSARCRFGAIVQRTDSNRTPADDHTAAKAISFLNISRRQLLWQKIKLRSLLNKCRAATGVSGSTHGQRGRCIAIQGNAQTKECSVGVTAECQKGGWLTSCEGVEEELQSQFPVKVQQNLSTICDSTICVSINEC